MAKDDKSKSEIPTFSDAQIYEFLFDFENRLRWLELQARLTKEEFNDLLRSKR